MQTDLRPAVVSALGWKVPMQNQARNHPGKYFICRMFPVRSTPHSNTQRSATISNPPEGRTIVNKCGAAGGALLIILRPLSFPGKPSNQRYHSLRPHAIGHPTRHFPPKGRTSENPAKGIFTRWRPLSCFILTNRGISTTVQLNSN